MTLPTHVLFGAIIGKVTGNYALAIGSSVVPDLDHLVSYVKNGVIRDPVKFWKTIMSQDDPYGDQRWILHNLVFCIFISAVFFALVPFFVLTIALGWLGHIFLDALDNSEYWPFYPNKRVNIRGPVRYASIQEFLLLIFLLVIFLII